MLQRDDRTQRRVSFSTYVLALLCCLGCQSEVPKFQVHGQVVYKDTGEPVPGVLSVVFESTDPPYSRSSGSLNPEGKFDLSSRRQGDGSMQGEHRIRFTAESTMAEPNPNVTVAKYIDKKYSEFGTSGIVLNIKPDNNNDFLIEVERGTSKTPPPPPVSSDGQELVR